jgi:hypothetical protein
MNIIIVIETGIYLPLINLFLVKRMTMMNQGYQSMLVIMSAKKIGVVSVNDTEVTNSIVIIKEADNG